MSAVVAHSEAPSAPPRKRYRTALVSTAGHCRIACGFCFRADRAHGFLDVSTYTRTLSRLKEIGVEGICHTVHSYLDQQRADTTHLSRYFSLTPRFLEYLTGLRTMHLHPEDRPLCSSASLYVSAGGDIRRCPYGSTGVNVQAPRAEITQFLDSDPQHRTTPECAAVCRADETRWEAHDDARHQSR